MNENINIPQPDFSLINALFLIAVKIKLIFKITSFFIFLGIVYVVLSTNYYDSTIKIIPESGNTDKNGLYKGIATLRSFGFDFGLSGSTGLYPKAYPAVFKSKEVLIPSLYEEISFNDTEEKMIVIEKIMKSDNPFFRVLSSIKNLFISSNDAEIKYDGKKTQKKFSNKLSRDEDIALKKLSSMIYTFADEETGIIQLTVRTNSPEFSYELNRLLSKNFKTLIQKLFTQKARDNLDFFKNRLTYEKNKLEEAENTLAEFIENNSDLTAPKVKLEYERIKRNVTFNTDVYQQIRSQLISAEIEYQRAIPVFSTIEEPLIPYKKTGPKRFFIVILSGLLGILISIVIISILNILDKQKLQNTGKKQWEVINNTFNIRKSFRRS